VRGIRCGVLRRRAEVSDHHAAGRFLFALRAIPLRVDAQSADALRVLAAELEVLPLLPLADGRRLVELLLVVGHLARLPGHTFFCRVKHADVGAELAGIRRGGFGCSGSEDGLDERDVLGLIEARSLSTDEPTACSTLMPLLADASKKRPPPFFANASPSCEVTCRAGRSVLLPTTAKQKGLVSLE
jgi:hypothetical protein